MTALAVPRCTPSYRATTQVQIESPRFDAERKLRVLTDTAVVLDFETTGLNCAEGNRVTEVAALRIQGGAIIERFESLVNCGVRIPSHITAFTGITQAMVDGAPPPAEVFARLLHFIGPHTVIAHNAWFDHGFLLSECRRLGLNTPDFEFLCSFKLARRLLPELQSHALGCLASRLRLQLASGIHRAAVDATIVANVVFQMCERLRAQTLQPVNIAVLRRLESLDPSSDPQLDVASAA